MPRIGQGDLDAQISTRGTDEIAEMASALGVLRDLDEKPAPNRASIREA